MPRRKNFAAAIRKNESLQQIAKDLTAPGESGRSIPAPVRGTTLQTESPGTTEITTYFTRPNGKTNLFYNPGKPMRVKLLLESAGPVSIGTGKELLPVLSGRGILLPTGEYVEFTLNKGDRLYVASTAINRMQVFTEPLPWLESILITLKNIMKGWR